jgi:hypothetical protein
MINSIIYLDDSRLIQAQRFIKETEIFRLLLTVGFYILNIVDANVDAHLLQFNVNDNLSLHPEFRSKRHQLQNQSWPCFKLQILMKIALLGYGKMGQAIEKIALERGHEIVCEK